MSTNLLERPFVLRIFKSRLFPSVFQAVTAAVFVLIMFQLVAGPSAAHDNLGTALTWVLWWPLIPIIFVFMGRFWCALCPFGTLNDVVQKYVGLKRPAPKFLKNYGIWIIDALFILITWSDHVWGIVENPWGSGMLLLLLTTGVVISGALWQRRTWCRYLCFLGGLSGNYARSGMLELRTNQDICAKCTSRAACYNGNENGPGCPMFEFPRKMESSASCNLCAACIKTCPHDAITLKVRPPSKELWFIRKPKLEEAFLAVIIMGIVFVQNVTMLEVWQSLLAGLERITHTTSYMINFTVTFLIAMALPVALISLAALAAKRFNGDTFLGNFAKFGYVIIPLDIAGHIAHNLYHLLAEGKAVVFTALPLFGMAAQDGSPALMSTSSIQVFQFILLAIGAIGSLYAIYRVSQTQYGQSRTWGALASYGALVVVLVAVNVYLFILPMAMRM